MTKEQNWDDAIEQFTLKTFRVGTDSINYSILKNLPTTITKIMEKFNLTKMPVNKRVNELEEVGLVIRVKGNGNVKNTNLTKKFLIFIEKIQENIKEEIPALLTNSMK